MVRHVQDNPPHVKHLAKLGNPSTVILLQVIEPSVASESYYNINVYYSIDLAEQLTQEAREYLEGVQEDFHAMDIAVKNVIAHGPVVGSILKVAREENADLIAMASHGRTGLASVFYGSEAAGV